LQRVIRRNSVPALVALTALVSTAAVWRYVSDAVESQQRERFADVTLAHRGALRARLVAYEATLRAGRGFLESLGHDPTGEEFHRFVEPLELTRHHPGIQGFGWARFLSPAELESHVRAERAAGRADYRVWPEGLRDVYTSIVHLEPLDWRNRRALGYDMYSEPIRREAMARAADTGDVAASRPVELVQEAGPERQAGFLMYVPVFVHPATRAADLRPALRGWIYAPFRAADLVGAIGAIGTTGAVGIAVYDGDREVPEALLYADQQSAAPRPLRVAVERLEVAGRAWTLRYVATSAFATGWERVLPSAVLGVGLALAALLFLLTRDEAQARRRAERAATRAAFLAESGTILAGSLDYVRTLPEVARLAAERLTRACVILVNEKEGPLLAVSHRDPAVGRRLEEALRESGLASDAETMAATAQRERRPQRALLAKVASLERAPAVAAVLREAGLRKLLTVPLVARGEALGAITFLTRRRRLEAADVALGEDLARLVVAAIDTARLYGRAQEALQERDDFLSIASHELKTPLTSLLLQSEALRNSARRSDADAVARKAEVIRRNVDRLSRLVSSLLDLSRIAAGRLEIELEDVELGALVREVATRFEEQAERAGCALVVDTPPEAVIGRWDGLRVDEVLTNLLSNAIKYGPGRPVELRVHRDGDVARVSVRDHGIGISEADQRRIFERFERAVSKRNYGGFGLGLWISRQIVQSLGGDVRVESAPGKGSTFTVELPGALRAGEAAGE
jgi:signal transduction histidine kinase